MLFKPELYALLVSLKTDKINAQSALTTVLLPAYRKALACAAAAAARQQPPPEMCGAPSGDGGGGGGARPAGLGGRRGRVAAGGALGGVAVRTVRAGRTPSGCAAAAADGSRGVISC